MDSEILEKYMKAGKIAAEVVEESRQWVFVGAKLLDIAEKIENLIKEKGGEPAFPVNLSLNEIAAHYTPIKNDETVVKENDILKIDIGVHVDGYVGDTAYTVCFNKKYDKMLEVNKKALEEAVKMFTPGTKLEDISAKIEETIKDSGYKPITNLTGHGLDRYALHTEPSIPNVKINSNIKLKKDQVLAVEPFVTDGAGMVRDSENSMIFSLVALGSVRNQDARKIINFVQQYNGLPFADRWLDLPVIKTKLALRELLMRGIVTDHSPLKEIGGGMVTQAEHTIIVDDEPIITTKI